MTDLRLGWRVAWPAALALGVLSALNFAPVNLPFAMIGGVAGLIWIARGLRSARKRTVMVTGSMYALGFMAPLIWWMNAISPGAYVGLVIGEMLYFMPILLLLRAAVRLRLWPLWGAAAWVLGEQVRGVFPFAGFPWGRLAHTSIDTPLSSYVRLVAVPGTSAVLFVVSALLVVLVTAAAWRTRGLAVLGVIAILGLGAVLPTGIAGADGTRQVALVQGDVPGEFLHWPPGEIFTLHARETSRLADRIDAGEVRRPDMVLWPENATDTDPSFDPAVSDEIEALSARIGAPILVGGIFDGPTVETAYNAGVVWTAAGPGERYIKRELVTFGEYVPFRRQLGALIPLINREIPRDMVSGNEPGALHVGNTTIADTICWDIAYDGVVRSAVKAGGQVLVVQTSNASFTGTSQPEQQFDISRLRAIETGRWVLVPSTNGVTGIADPEGNTVQRAPLHRPAMLNQEITLASGTTPALEIGGAVQWILVVLGLAAWWLGTRAGRKKTPTEAGVLPTTESA